MVSAALIFKDLTSETYSDNFHGLNQVNSLRKKIKVQKIKTLQKIIMTLLNDIFQMRFTLNITMAHFLIK